MGRSGIGPRPGVGGIDEVEGVGEGGEVGKVGCGGGIVEHAATKAISAAMHSARMVGPNSIRSGRCSFGKGAQPGFETRASTLGEVAEFTGVFKGFLGQRGAWLSRQQFAGQRPEFAIEFSFNLIPLSLGDPATAFGEGAPSVGAASPFAGVFNRDAVKDKRGGLVRDCETDAGALDQFAPGACEPNQ